VKRACRTQVIRRWIGCYFLILFWEFATIPAVSHSDSWRGVPVSLLALPVSAYWLANVGARPGTLFVYGTGGGLLFLPRFLMMDRFSLWLKYQAPSDTIIVVSWVAFVLFMGVACCCVGLLAGCNATKAKSTKETEDRTQVLPHEGPRDSVIKGPFSRNETGGENQHFQIAQKDL
jgi:hypothetical protein